MKKILALFLFSIVMMSHGKAQQNQFLDHYTIDDGLPDRELSQVVKDENGFMWLGTSYGLSRFDGYNFLNFNGTNTPQFSDNKVTALLTFNHHLWVATASNLLLLDLNTYQWKEITQLKNINRLFKDSKNQIWLVGNDDEVFYITKAGNLKKVEASQPAAPWVRATVNVVQTMDEGANGVWWSRLDGTLRQYDADNDTVEIIFDGSKFKMRGSAFLVHDTLVWHSTNYYIKLFHIDGREFPIAHDASRRLTRAGTITALPDVKILLTDLENRIVELIASKRKTVFYDNLSNSLSTTRAVNSVFKDHNLLWLATNSGLYKTDFETSNFKKILNYENGLNSIRSIIELDDQSLLVSAYTGLHFLNEKLEIDSMINRPFYVIYEMIPKAKNTYWVASEGTGLLEFNAKSREIKHLTYSYDKGGHPARYLTSLAETDSLLYIGEYTGLYFYNKLSGLMDAVKNTSGEPLLEGQHIKDLHLDGKGVLWIASNNGIYSLTLASSQFTSWTFEPIKDESFETRVIYETLDHQLWFGTRNHGLLRLAKDRKELKQWKKQDGLVFDAVNSIVASPDNRYLWLGTDLGLSQFDRTNNTFNNYFEKDGLTNNEFNRNAVLLHSDEQIYMGGINGVNIFHPSQDSKKINTSNIMLTGFSKYDGELQQVVKEHAQVIHQRDFTISPTDRFFSIHFALDNYSHIEKNQFRYKIEPIHKNWVDLGTQHELLIDNLDAGNYQVKIQGASGEGQWSENELAINLTIQEVYYKKVWFFLMIIAMLAFLGWLAHKIRVRQLLKLERMRTRIARDLHDELGSSLTRISMYSELAKENAQRLDQLSDLSKEAASTLSDIVWSIDNENDTLDELIERMREHLMIMLKPTAINYSFKVAELNKHTIVNAEAKQHLFLIFKEAINNILKHANATLIQVTMARKNKDFVMLIENDGANRENENLNRLKGGKGTKSMKARAEALKGHCTFKINDTTYLVSISIPYKSL